MYKLRIILAMFIFGTLGLFVKNINLASSEIAFWRAAIAIVVLCVCLIFSKRKNKRKIDEKRAIRLFVSGAIMGFNWILLFESYKFTSIAVATLCYYFEPVIVVVASFFMFNEKIGIKKALCFGVATLGLMLMCHKVTHKKLIDNSPLFRKNFKVEFHGSHTNCVASFA